MSQCPRVPCSLVRLSHQCPVVPVSQSPIFDLSHCLRVCPLSQRPIVPVPNRPLPNFLIVPVSIVLVSDRPMVYGQIAACSQCHCPIVNMFDCPTDPLSNWSTFRLSQCLLSHCYNVKLSHRPLSHCPIGPLFHCPWSHCSMSRCPLSQYPLSHCS
jgi:hypothetical protein